MDQDNNIQPEASAGVETTAGSESTASVEATQGIASTDTDVPLTGTLAPSEVTGSAFTPPPASETIPTPPTPPVATEMQGDTTPKDEEDAIEALEQVEKIIKPIISHAECNENEHAAREKEARN